MLMKADLHLHQEWSPRLDRVLARRHGRPPFDWSDWRRELVTEVPAGLARLQRLSRVQPAPAAADSDDAFVARVTDALIESAADGSCYTELRFGNDTILRENFMELFRLAESRVRRQYPSFRAEALVGLLLWQEPERLQRVLTGCRRAAEQGLAGVDLLYVPYAAEADWQLGREIVAHAAGLGLGVTVHAGEFSTANIAAVAGIEGVTRIGHATAAHTDPWLLELLAERGITVEVCLSANVMLGAVPDLATHPLRTFVDAGIRVALGAGHPVQVGTTIGREYELAGRIGLSLTELLDITRNAVAAGFTTADRKAALLDQIERARLTPVP